MDARALKCSTLMLIGHMRSCSLIATDPMWEKAMCFHNLREDSFHIH